MIDYLIKGKLNNSTIQSLNNKPSGGRRIRTFVAEATDLQSVPFDRSGIPPSFDFGLRISIPDMT